MADETHDTPPLSDERLAEIRARLVTLNPGVWEYDAGFTSHIWNGSEIIAADVLERNAPFLVHAPGDMRTLLAEVDRLRAALDTARQLIERLEEHAELPIAHPLNTAIDDWLRSIGV